MGASVASGEAGFQLWGQCDAVVWWEGGGSCFKCFDPSKREEYTNAKDTGYPPHVLVKKATQNFDDHMPMWCGLNNRAPLLGPAASGEACFQLCGQCNAVVWWEGGGSCFQCFDPSKRLPYTNANDTGYPPHVLVKKAITFPTPRPTTTSTTTNRTAITTTTTTTTTATTTTPKPTSLPTPKPTKKKQETKKKK